jgi:hypothetical protein
MKIYPQVPEHLVAGWRATHERPEPGARAGRHYHDVEEWLQVDRGDVTFRSAGEREYRLVAGQALHIPRGEVHRVEIGPDGVDYQMWIPVGQAMEPFQNVVDDELATLIQKNVEVPRAEDAGSVPFFEDFLSEEVVFRTAKGAILDKEGFMARGFANQGRVPGDSVRVLHRAQDSILLATAVGLPADGGRTQLFVNERLFVREGKALRCRVWLNYPDVADR